MIFILLFVDKYYDAIHDYSVWIKTSFNVLEMDRIINRFSRIVLLVLRGRTGIISSFDFIIFEKYYDAIHDYLVWIKTSFNVLEMDRIINRFLRTVLLVLRGRTGISL